MIGGGQRDISGAEAGFVEGGVGQGRHPTIPAPDFIGASAEDKEAEQAVRRAERATLEGEWGERLERMGVELTALMRLPIAKRLVEVALAEQRVSGRGLTTTFEAILGGVDGGVREHVMSILRQYVGRDGDGGETAQPLEIIHNNAEEQCGITEHRRLQKMAMEGVQENREVGVGESAETAESISDTSRRRVNVVLEQIRRQFGGEGVGLQMIDEMQRAIEAALSRDAKAWEALDMARTMLDRSLPNSWGTATETRWNQLCGQLNALISSDMFFLDSQFQ